MENDIRIPNRVRIGGHLIETEFVDDMEDKLGQCCVPRGYIKIADKYDGKKQTESSKVNTYVHECIHSILDTMGRSDLSQDEGFVSCFAVFATEALYYIMEHGYDNAVEETVSGGRRKK